MVLVLERRSQKRASEHTHTKTSNEGSGVTMSPKDYGEDVEGQDSTSSTPHSMFKKYMS